VSLEKELYVLSTFESKNKKAMGKRRKGGNQKNPVLLNS